MRPGSGPVEGGALAISLRTSASIAATAAAAHGVSR
jgi:hypothetical protein